MDYFNLDKRLPFSFEAEQSVLGAVLIKPECFGDINLIINGEDFYMDEHRDIYYALHHLFAENKNIDHVTLANALIAKGVMDAKKAKEEITKIVSAVPSAANATDYAKIVKDRALRRNLINICQEISESAQSETNSAQNILEAAEKKIYSLSDENVAGGFRHINEIIRTNYHMLQNLATNPEQSSGLETGFHGVDNLLTGMGKGDMVLVGARPGVGKTSFVMNIATRVAKRSGKNVCVFSLEMSSEQLVMRMLSTEAKIDNTVLRTGKLAPDNWAAIALATAELANCNILIDDTPGISATQMKSKLRRVKNLGLVVIDYLQLMQGETRTDNRANEVGEISRGIKLMAKEFGVPVLTCAQLNRAVTARKDGQPQLSDLRESGSIEQDADSVMFLHRPEGEEHQVEVIVAKNRHGATGKTVLGWNPNFTSFFTIENNLSEDN